MMQQYERELLVGAFLDITVEQFFDKKDAAIREIENTPAESQIANAIFHLNESCRDDIDDDQFWTHRQCYIQAIALMSDKTLKTAVKAFGTLP